MSQFYAPNSDFYSEIQELTQILLRISEEKIGGWGLWSEDGVFSQFLLSLLKWAPEERATAGEALQHKFVSIVHAKKVRMSIEEPVDILQDLDQIKMCTPTPSRGYGERGHSKSEAINVG